MLDEKKLQQNVEKKCLSSYIAIVMREEMGKNFSDFKCDAETKTEDFAYQNTQQTHEKNLRQAYEDFSSLSPDELTKKLTDEVRKRKDEGSLDVEMLLSSVESIKMFLPMETYNNLKQLIENIR